jgi:hypothetical protein
MKHVFTIDATELHVLMDALSRHAVALDIAATDPDSTDDPTRIYVGVFPEANPLRDRSGYRAALDSVMDTVNGMIGVTDTERVVCMVTEDAA